MKKEKTDPTLVSSRVTAVVLAGGRGTRLSPLEIETPKAMISVGGKPMLQWNVAWVKSQTGTVYVAAGSQIEIIREGITADPHIIFTKDPDIGTGRALIEAASLVNAEHIIVCNADTINELDLNRVLQNHLRRGKGSTIALTRREDAQNAGAFLVTSDGQVLRSLEDLQPQGQKSQSIAWQGASTGVIIIPVLALLRDERLKKAVSLEQEIIPHLIDTGGLFAFDNGGKLCLDIGTPERLQFMRRNEKALIKLALSGVLTRK